MGTNTEEHGDYVRAITAKECVCRIYSEASCFSKNGGGCTIYYIGEFGKINMEGPTNRFVFFYMTTANSEEEAWEIVWEDIQNEFMKKLES